MLLLVAALGYGVRLERKLTALRAARWPSPRRSPT
jgi:hypothetical protein